MEKTLKELEEEYSDIINDKNLQDIAEWKSPIDTMKPPKSELRKDSKIKFKQNQKDIPPDDFDFRSEKASRAASESIKYLLTKKP